MVTSSFTCNSLFFVSRFVWIYVLMTLQIQSPTQLICSPARFTLNTTISREVAGQRSGRRLGFNLLSTTFWLILPCNPLPFLFLVCWSGSSWILALKLNAQCSWRGKKKWASLYQMEGKKMNWALSGIQPHTPPPKNKPTEIRNSQPPTPCKQTAEWASSWPSQIPCFINKLHYLCLDYFHYRGHLQGYQDPRDLIRSQRDTADNRFLTGLCRSWCVF